MRVSQILTTWGVPIGVVVVSVLVIAAFSGGSGGGFGSSARDIERVSNQIRDHVRNRWLVQTKRMLEISAEMEEVRQEHLTRIRDGGLGVDYLETFVAIAVEEHAPIDSNLFAALNDPNVPLSAVYAATKAAELQMTNWYRDVRAAQNAITLEVPAVDALGWVKVVQPRRLEVVGEDLDRPAITSQTQLAAFRRQVSTGESELDAMVQQSERILEQARDAQGGASVEGIAIMAPPGGPEGNRGDTLRPDELMPSRATSDGGFNATPGRIIDGSGEQNDWMYIDKWYVMGPFPNRFRQNLDASYLPETVIDLDNVTIGMDDQEVRWRYWDTKNSRIEPDHAPPYCVYYAWTEVYVEEAGKYWVALGSDDFGKVWINGELVWTSSMERKTWRADEEIAEFEFKQGLNEILFRCENAGGTMGWSVVINTMPNE
ncbi:MAG: hypothetical protein EA401_14575 [Planctomycetota bacterium]|nr:MAG: hypothetical protein EA401_14575 [Planctomycetota bacterium]